jgi:hypothetical protein
MVSITISSFTSIVAQAGSQVGMSRATTACYLHRLVKNNIIGTSSGLYWKKEELE